MTRPPVFVTTFEVLFLSEARCWGRLTDRVVRWLPRTPRTRGAPRPPLGCPPTPPAPEDGLGGAGPQALPGEPAPPLPPHWVTVTESVALEIPLCKLL